MQSPLSPNCTQQSHEPALLQHALNATLVDGLLQVYTAQLFISHRTQLSVCSDSKDDVLNLIMQRVA